MNLCFLLIQKRFVKIIHLKFCYGLFDIPCQCGDMSDPLQQNCEYFILQNELLNQICLKQPLEVYWYGL